MRLTRMFKTSKILAFAPLAIVLTGCLEEKQAQFQAPPPSVTVQTIKMEQIDPFTEFVGRTQATEDVVIKARVKGNLLSRSFEGGHDVKKGDLLFEIDPAPYLAIVNQKKASLTQAKATNEIAVIKWKRGKLLHDAGTISDMNMDELIAAKLKSAAEVTAAKASLDASNLDLKYTKIVAPIDGRISRTHVSIGDLISPDTTEMATLVQLDPVWVNFQASEKAMVAAQKMATGMNVKVNSLSELLMNIKLADGETYPHQGEIDFVDNRVDQSTGTLAIRATFPNPEKMLLPGQYVTVVITAPETQSAILVPQASVQEDQQGRFVLVVDNKNEVKKRIVKMGQRFGIKWEVEDGVNEGDKVIVEGIQKVRPGIKVKATEQTAEAFASQSS